MRVITLILSGRETVTEDAVVGFVGERGEVTSEFRGVNFADCFEKIGNVIDREKSGYGTGL